MPTGDLAPVMDALVAVENTVHADLRVYRWRPLQVELPALFNLLGESPAAIRDQVTHRETVHVIARIAIRPTDADEEMARLETYIDAFRSVVDRALYRQDPLAGTLRMAKRTGLNGTVDQFGQAPVLCADFPLEFQLDRRITPGS